MSGKIAEDAVPKVPVLIAVEEDVNDDLASCSTVATRAGYIWHSSGEEETVQPYLLGPQLHQQRALPFGEAFVELENFLGGRERVPVGSSSLSFFAPFDPPRPFSLCLAPSSQG